MTDWTVHRFAELLEDGAISYGIVQPGSHTETDSVPVLRVNNIRNGTITTAGVLKVARSIEDKYRRTRLTGGELLITVVGSVGECAIVPRSLAGWNVARAVSVARIKSEFDTRFVKYAFRLDDVVFQMYGNTNDTVQPTLNLAQLKDLEFTLPPLSEQKGIAAVLSSLDDKIDLLHRQNKTLEALAETLFRQWFVEEAQDDWEEVPLDEVADFLNGLACQKYPPQNEVDKLPVLKIKELKGGVSENSDWATKDVKEQYIVRSGDIIFSWSGSLVVKIWDGGECVLNQHLFKVSSQSNSKWFIYLWTRLHLQKFIAIAESKATTMGHIKRRDLSNSMVLVPDALRLEAMNAVMEPLIDKLILNNAQVHKLEKLRDTLLPKLMSGEVRVEHEN